MKEEVHIGQKRIIILGTVHAHQESIELVRKTILDVRPDYVAVELDPERLEALESGNVKNRGIEDLFKLGFRGAAIMLISYSNRKKAKRVSVSIMSDMLEAVKTAREIETKVELIDTAQLSFDIPFPEFAKLIFFLIRNSMKGIRTDQKSVDRFTEELNKAAPSLSLLDERDKVMAQNILELSGTIVVVTGMGHVKSIKKELLKQYNA
ncbi:MAG: hypothetical protein HXS46_20200 [Theionarchaea archaeon]|nr:MAG: hypothetical protein AYK18_15790 [Theionarchaea archaeon DG-70]MBU7013012.1 hypothetical protein [Theionarchaea archaeon]